MRSVRRGGSWVKSPDDPSEAAFLEREGEALTALTHPGVTKLLGRSSDPLELRVQLVEGAPLGTLRLPAEQVAGFGEAAVTVVGDLHDLGWTHGALSADHILVDHAGRPVLCSFGRARFHGPGRIDPEVGKDDVATLAGALLGVLSDSEDRRSHRRLRRVLSQAQSGTMGAQDLRRAIRRAVPGAVLPCGQPHNRVAMEPRPGAPLPVAPLGASIPSPGRLRSAWGDRRKTLMRGALVAAALLAAAAWAGSVGWSTLTGSSGARGPTLRRPHCPPVDDGCRPLPMSGPIFSTPAGAWSLGQAGDVVVLGRWMCGGPATPAVLQPGSGRIWLFTAWTTAGGAGSRRLLATVPGARSLATLPAASGCDSLAVLRRGRPATLLQPQGR